MKKRIVVWIAFICIASLAAQKRFNGIIITWLKQAALQAITSKKKMTWIEPWLINSQSSQSPESIIHADLILIMHGYFDLTGDAFAIPKNNGVIILSDVGITHYLSAQGVPEKQLIGKNISGTVND